MADPNLPPVNVTNEVGDLQARARELVYLYVQNRLSENIKFTRDQVLFVWFSKTLQNWKALLITTLPDQMYYELTYDGDRKQTYIDAYQKIDNVCVYDTLEQTGFEIKEF